ncbi:MAG: hypothetical protein SGARI_002162 [Bacillariaceae sp.]
MCNPNINSSIASRRYRLANQLLTQKLVGSLISTEPSKPVEKVTPPPSTTSEAISNERVAELKYTSSVPYAPPISGYFADIDQPQKVQPSFFYEQPPAPQSIDTGATTATKPKRRRKPQKPGLTAKGSARHFVEHHYHDHAMDPDDDISSDDSRHRGGVMVSFPLKLHTVLDQVEEDGFSSEFTETVMPRYFRQTKLTSFQRQLNLYGYQRITRGNDSGKGMASSDIVPCYWT